MCTASPGTLALGCPGGRAPLCACQGAALLARRPPGAHAGSCQAVGLQARPGLPVGLGFPTRVPLTGWGTGGRAKRPSPWWMGPPAPQRPGWAGELRPCRPGLALDPGALPRDTAISWPGLGGWSRAAPAPLPASLAPSFGLELLQCSSTLSRSGANGRWWPPGLNLLPSALARPPGREDTC